MTRIRVELPEALTSMPVKAFLTQHEGISSTQWKRIKHSGTFRVGGILCNAARTEVKTGDIISFDIVRPSDIEPEDLPLNICYEDDYLLIVNKPAGQLVHPTTKEAHGTLGNAVLYWYKAHDEHHAYHPVHRLDRNTSGLVLIAKVPQVQYKLTPRHGEGKLFHREYLALIEGELTPPEGLIDAPIARACRASSCARSRPTGRQPARITTPCGRMASSRSCTSCSTRAARIRSASTSHISAIHSLATTSTAAASRASSGRPCTPQDSTSAIP